MPRQPKKMANPTPATQVDFINLIEKLKKLKRIELEWGD